MTINPMEQIRTPDEAAGDSTYKFQNELQEKLSCLLFGNATNLLEDILDHPLSVDYFNIYLSLPIFGQRVFYQRRTHEFDFDPPLFEMCKKITEETKAWLMNYRLNHYIHTDIYIESLLSLLLTKAESTEIVDEKQSNVFSTATDVHQFYQFLQSTSGIKYWNFFLDSMRLLQFRRFSRSHRIDISYLNFIYKYYSRQQEFHSIMNDQNYPSMPDSTTSDTIWFSMAINAMQQLRLYWLPRYLSQVSLPSRWNIKPTTIESNPKEMKTDVTSLSGNATQKSSNYSKMDSTIKEPQFIKFTVGNISYLEYNPRQWLIIQPTKQHDFQQDFEELNNSKTNNNTNPIEEDNPRKMTDTSARSSDRSIEDYANDANLELFYRILISDSLAGTPFLEYISQAIPKTESVLYQTCLRFITDAEILLSILSGKFKERIVKQFISRYLEVTVTEKFLDEIFDFNEAFRSNLITELIIKDHNEYPLLWKVLLNITKFLIPHFLNYIKFDRLRCLIQGKPFNPTRIFNDLRSRLPSVHFDTLFKDWENTKATDLKQSNSQTTEYFSRLNLFNCGEQQNDLHMPSTGNQYTTTEKLINTDERCEFRQDERFPPLTDQELEEELRQFGSKFEWKDGKTVLEKSFDVPITLPHVNNTTFIDDPISHQKIQQTSISNEDIKLKSIETFALDIMNSAKEVLDVDRFVTNLMNESLHQYQINRSQDSLKSDLNSSPLTPVLEEILLTDSSPTTTSAKLITKNINNNALESSNSRPHQSKILSLTGSYFINPSSTTKPTDNFLDHPFSSPTINMKKDGFFHESIKFAQKDASNEANDNLTLKPISYFPSNDQQKLLRFLQNHITNHQWSLEEYIGLQGHRAWRAFKLAADISHLDHGLMFNYHHDFDWLSTDDHFGSFTERTEFIVRNFHPRVTEQNRC